MADIIKYNKDLYKSMKISKKIGFLTIDEENGLFYFDNLFISLGHITPKVFKLKDLVSYKIVEDSKEVTSGGISIKRAIVGNIIAGPAGMVLGGLTGEKTHGKKIKSIKLVFNMVGDFDNKVELINKPIIVGSEEYKNLVEKINNIDLFFYNYLQNKNNKSIKEPTKTSSTSVTDELIKLKSLLDSEIITNEEFAKLKTDLLNK
ncbi:SHOCT domain-containing protein [Vaginisenegalia massiliensis]|uniref:SHOCT domain-containing protein n=1 Tax=Vaginisenegalia massiliensis TaxID=2058294 RepID=UPI000F5478D3|nr:SHOCT domain-containing protein [Vaginisenegalia massiliensis]